MEKGKKKILTCLMVVITLLMVFPFVWMLMLSFKTSGEIMSNPLALPTSLNLSQYTEFCPALWKHLPGLYSVFVR